MKTLGLANLGNTCYMNSCIQILANIPELQRVISSGYARSSKNTKLVKEWLDLNHLLHQTGESTNIIVPNRFVAAIQHYAAKKNMVEFTGYDQCDAAEFMIFFMDCIHSALSIEVEITISGKAKTTRDKLARKCFEMVKTVYSKDYSEIWNLFYGIHVSEISHAETGEIIGLNPEPFFMIDLPIPQQQDINLNPTSLFITDCLNEYVKQEIVEGYEHEKLRINIFKSIKFWSLPSILVFNLKRHKQSFVGRIGTMFKKNQTFIDFPLQGLDLSDYIIGYCRQKYQYDLYAVCNHHGGMNGGHYTATIFVNGRWHLYNDTQVQEIDESKVKTPQAYLLFYRRKP